MHASRVMMTLATVLSAAAMIWPALPVAASGNTAVENPRIYVGSAACGECHGDQYETFKLHSKKAHSFASVKKMQRGLTPAETAECYKCHTTGYGRPGGAHAESQDPADIVATVDVESCTVCHNGERVNAFKFKPLIFGGAH
jgi:hypothetical protein